MKNSKRSRRNQCFLNKEGVSSEGWKQKVRACKNVRPLVMGYTAGGNGSNIEGSGKCGQVERVTADEV